MNAIVNDPAETTIVLTGDLVLDLPDPDHWLSGIAPAIRAADLAIGHLEVPHTHSTAELKGDVPAPGSDPANLAALARAGFDAVTLAGNHIADCGAAGIADTIAELDRLGIAHGGAGATLAEARKPAVLECGGRRIALLSYNCVGPQAAWATETTAGCAYLPVATGDGSPPAPAAPLTEAAPEAFAILEADIAAARAQADLVIVALHKGIVHRPFLLAPYERPLAQGAIDAGADVVVGHHSHILRGIEFHRGRPIFHGLGNGCVVTSALSPDQDHPARREWARRRRELFGFEPDPAYLYAPFHPEAVNALVARLVWRADGTIDAGFLPIHVEAPGRPVLASLARGVEIIDYVQSITDKAELPPLRLAVRNDMVEVMP
jgi:poly-gamma-glutamate synthesis protein (capsule biosynthesis protein)